MRMSLPKTKLMRRLVDKVIIHCTATREGVDVTTEMIDDWHRMRGFKSIGYHYVIYRNGTIVKGRLEAEPGAHCLGHNANSVGVCYVGGLDKNGNPKDTRTPEQKAALIKLIDVLKGRYVGVTIHGHREFANKACPCFDAFKEYN